MEERIKNLKEKINNIQDVIKLSNASEEVLALANYSGTSKLMIGAKSALLLFMVSQLFNTRSDGTVWEPNWKNYNEKKWFPVFDMDSSTPSGVGFSGSTYDYWDSGTGVGSRLAFEFKELSDLSAELFPETYIALLTK